tara:strand:+ start:959 stop:1099 length:141 start_codon:yes stop_codon:yes gene_type:complete
MILEKRQTVKRERWLSMGILAVSAYFAFLLQMLKSASSSPDFQIHI